MGTSLVHVHWHVVPVMSIKIFKIVGKASLHPFEPVGFNHGQE